MYRIHPMNSIDKLEENRVLVRPNPFTGTLEISNAPFPCTLHLFDVFGNILFEDKINNFIYERDFSFINTGIYFLNIQSKNISYTKRIVKIY
jgi:hypothetical protein